MHGLLNVHKPPGVTSRDVVNRFQRLLKPAKVGHAGTLDPLATGVLVVCVGQGTRLVEYVQLLPKTYLATFLFGRRSDTEDVEGTVELLPEARQPERGEVDAALPKFLGEIQQRPPQYSAIKVAGRRAYDLARRGQTVELAERPVTIYRLEVVEYAYPELQLRIECGSGTYVRSLGRDLAESLGTNAVMSALTRERIGSFQLDEAIDPNHATAEVIQSSLLPLARACESLPQLRLTEAEVTEIRNGRRITRPDLMMLGPIAAVDAAGRLVAIVAAAPEGQLRPEKVFL